MVLNSEEELSTSSDLVEGGETFMSAFQTATGFHHTSNVPAVWLKLHNTSKELISYKIAGGNNCKVCGGAWHKSLADRVLMEMDRIGR